MIPSFSLLGSLHILQQQTNHHAPLPLWHSIHRSKTPHPTDLHAVQVPVETVLSLSHSCKLSPIVRGHIPDVNRRVNGYGRHHSPTIRFRLHTCLEVEGLSLSILPPPAHSTMPCGISPETPNDSESGRRNDCISLLPLRRESMKTCGFQTFPSVTDHGVYQLIKPKVDTRFREILFGKTHSEKSPSK